MLTYIHAENIQKKRRNHFRADFYQFKKLRVFFFKFFYKYGKFFFWFLDLNYCKLPACQKYPQKKEEITLEPIFTNYYSKNN